MTGSNALGATTFGYDPMGNMTSYAISGYTPVTYAYDAFNRMQTATFGGTIGTYGYNAYGERTSKVAAPGTAAPGTFRYTYGEDQRLLAERQEANNLWTNYLWFGGQLVGITRGTQLYFLHTDHLGRPELATKSTLTVMWQSNNSAFGDRTVTTDFISGLNVGFPGQYFDAETGFWYNMNRYYIGLYGRYSQSDPIGLAGGINPYTYAGGNPIGNIDLLGLCDCEGAGTAPSPQQYEQLGHNLQAITMAGGLPGLVVNVAVLTNFRRGGALDAQVLYGGSQAYANYVFGVEMSANGIPLQGALLAAGGYAQYSGATSQYDPAKVGPMNGSIPASNVSNITQGYSDQQSGTLCTIDGN